jgi:hypothetical protein
MLMMTERRLTTRTLRGWAIHVLQEAGAIRECEEHGWMQDRADPHARERALSPVETRQQASPLMKPRRGFARCWTRSAIPARSASK